MFPCLFLDPNMKIKKKGKNLLITSPPSRGFRGGSEGKESACNAGDVVFDPWVGKVLCRRQWLSTPVFLPGEFHRQRSLACYSPWGYKKSDTAELLSLTNETHCITENVT